jgi:hypothetical protein
VPNQPPKDIFEESGLDPEQWQPIDSAPVIPGKNPTGAVFPNPMSNYYQGSISPQLQHDVPFVGTKYGTPGIPSHPLMPLGVQGNPIQNAGVTSTVKFIAPAQSAAVPTPDVDDGLIHGDAIWESDSAYVLMRDDFISSNNSAGTNTINNIGAYYWNLVSSAAPAPAAGFLSSYPPNMGQYVWTNSATVNGASWLTFPVGGPGTDSFYASNIMYALAERPAWKATFVFKLESTQNLNTSLGTPFTTAGRAIYIGFTGSDFNALISAPVSRPSIFMGLRFDTSTTAPSINDSFFTFEVVTNLPGNSAVRNNVQGQTLVTTVAPIQGAWHRLDILCTTAGTVTMTLDGSASFTTTIPTATISFTSGANSTFISNGVAKISLGGSKTSVLVWGAGSSVTISGTTSTPSINGTVVLTGASDTGIDWASPATMGNTNTAGTLVGYPVYTPLFMMGNSDVAGPTANTMMMDVDYFSFVWNPGVGGGSTGTPDPTKARYF